jgi:hypothetical protein
MTTQANKKWETPSSGRRPEPDIGTPDPCGTDRSTEGWHCLMRPGGRCNARPEGAQLAAE